MIDFIIPRETPLAERHALLEPHTGQEVTLYQGHRETTGTLRSITGRGAILVGSVALKQIPLGVITRVLVRTGGDWVTGVGHGSGSSTERIHLRCTPQEKADAKQAAKAAGVSLSEWVMQLVTRASQGHRD